jgi:hypothetical protein
LALTWSSHIFVNTSELMQRHGPTQKMVHWLGINSKWAMKNLNHEEQEAWATAILTRRHEAFVEELAPTEMVRCTSVK